jgi:predicted phage gp36 major capsid-like protein
MSDQIVSDRVLTIRCSRTLTRATARKSPIRGGYRTIPDVYRVIPEMTGAPGRMTAASAMTTTPCAMVIGLLSRTIGSFPP